MTIPELITLVLTSIRNQWYADRVRDFKRDENALMKAIARYGYECDRRNWQFEAHEILTDVMQLLQKIKQTGADIKYMPVYLEGAIDRHIRLRAEELSAKAKAKNTVAHHAAAIAKNVKVTSEPIRLTDTETLGALYKDLKKRKKPLAKAQTRKEAQPDLLKL